MGTDMTTLTALWGAVILSGLYHGVNPGMGWPLAVSYLAKIDGRIPGGKSFNSDVLESLKLFSSFKMYSSSTTPVRPKRTQTSTNSFEPSSAILSRYEFRTIPGGGRAMCNNLS